MGSNRKLIFGAVLVVAGLVFWGLMNALSGVNRVATAPTPLPATQQVAFQPSNRMIAYAATDIPQGTLVTKNMIQMRALQGSGPTTPFVTNPETQALGFVTNTRIPKGALIRPSDDFVGHISEVGISGMLQPDRRAIVIPFANKPTLHDLVAIGDYVDINAAFDGQESRTIVPAVRVLAVDVFGADFPQVNIARRGAFKAAQQSDAPAAAAPGTPGAEGASGATPTPTPTPAPGGGRPDPAVTLEVTPQQANRILLAQASGAVLDFVVLPRNGGAVLVNDPETGTLIGDQVGSVGGLAAISAVTKPQIAPYAERKKASGGGARAAGARTSEGSTRVASSGSGPRRIDDAPRRFRAQPLPNFGASAPSPPVTTPFQPDASVSEPPAPPAESPTYNIPIYADGRTVRVETVPRPQE